MKYLHLLWASLFRKKLRTILTLLSIIVAFFLFGLLQSVSQAFGNVASQTQANRLVTNSRYSIIDLLPQSYLQRIASVPGVRAVSHATWFGGSYQDKPAEFAIFPVEPESYLQVAPEIKLPAEQLQAWKQTRTGAIIGRGLAAKYGWKPGDKVPVKADIWPQTGGELVWTFDIVGIYENTRDPGNGEQALLLRHDYFDEARQAGKGRVGWFILTIDDPKNADTVSQQIDALFRNSESETKTQTEAAFAQSFVNQIGDIRLIVTAILGAVFFTILVLTGNTMSQALRERIPEFGILKTLGFGNGQVLGFVLVEALLLTIIGGLIGLGLAKLTAAAMGSSLAQFGVTGIGWPVVWRALVVMVLLGLAVGLLPAVRAMRLKIIDALNA
jgi:putative ABC transport system permease protein